MRIGNDTLMADGTTTVDIGSSWTSEAIAIEHVMVFSIQLLFTGTPAGQFYLECSSEPFDKAKAAQIPSTWTTLLGSQQSISEAGDHTWNVEDTGYAWVRVKWAPTGGSGTLTKARINTKGA
jgi:hypothetical protein